MATFDEYFALLKIEATESIDGISEALRHTIVDRRGWVELQGDKATMTIKGQIEMDRMSKLPQTRPEGVTKKT